MTKRPASPASELPWTTVDHPDFKACYEAILGAYASSGFESPFHVRITGLSGLGKTELAKTLMRQYPESKDRHGPRKPVLYVQVPSSPTRKSLMKAIAWALGHVPGSGSAFDLMMWLLQLLVSARVEIIVFDEMNHLMREGGKIAMSTAADTLKEFINLSKLPAVMMGTPCSNALFEGGMQLRSRVGAEHPLRAFSWEDPVQRKTWLSLIKGQFPLGFENDDFVFIPGVAERIWFATFGVPRQIRFLLGSLHAIRAATGAREINLDLLSQAFRRNIFPPARPERNPFEREFNMEHLIRFGEPYFPDPIDGGYHEDVASLTASKTLIKRMNRLYG